MLEQTINHFQSWREAKNLVKSENMYILGLPISVHPTAPEDPKHEHAKCGCHGN